MQQKPRKLKNAECSRPDRVLDAATSETPSTGWSECTRRSRGVNRNQLQALQRPEGPPRRTVAPLHRLLTLRFQRLQMEQLQTVRMVFAVLTRLRLGRVNSWTLKSSRSV